VNKTVASVIDDINEWPNPHGGSVFFVTAICTDEDVLSVGRKDHDAALEVQGLLREAIGIEQDFVLEPAKPTKTGRTKWKVLGFGTPGGAATYTAPGVQGGGGSAESGDGVRTSRTRSPEQNDDIRRAVALKAAVQCVVGTSPEDVLAFADVFEAWLAKTSEPASSAYKGGDPASTVAVQAGADSEDLPQETRPLPADGAGLVDSGDGEAPESTPRYAEILAANEADKQRVDAALSEAHIHDYQLRQGVKGFLVCAGCGKTRKKEVSQATGQS
jgi:hypothetical protein